MYLFYLLCYCCYLSLERSDTLVSSDWLCERMLCSFFVYARSVIGWEWSCSPSSSLLCTNQMEMTLIYRYSSMGSSVSLVILMCHHAHQSTFTVHPPSCSCVLNTLWGHGGSSPVGWTENTDMESITSFRTKYSHPKHYDHSDMKHIKLIIS